jgi:hypothetical protein
MRRIIFSFVARLVLPYFLHYLVNGTISGGGGGRGGSISNVKYLFWFFLQFFFEKISRYMKNSDIYIYIYIYIFWDIINVHRASCTLLVIFNRFSENTLISNFMKFRPLVVELFHADRQTERHDEATTHLSHFSARARKKKLARFVGSFVCFAPLVSRFFTCLPRECGYVKAGVGGPVFTELVGSWLKTKLRGLSPRANYTDRAAAAGRRS